MSLDVPSLLARIASLEELVAELKPKAELFDRYKLRLIGNHGEDLMARWTLAKRIFGNEAHDMETSDGLKLEVKYSRLKWSKLGGVVKTPMVRWMWSNIVGPNARKVYDRLLLVGEVNPEYAPEYLDPDSAYIIFDLSFAEARKHGSKGCINLNSNPGVRTPCTLRDRLYQKHQVTVSELRQRYARG